MFAYSQIILSLFPLFTLTHSNEGLPLLYFNLIFFANWTKLYLSEPPVINRSFSGNLSTTVGAFQIFTCSVTSGRDPLAFSYYLNGNLIQGSSNVKIETNDKFALLRLQKIEKSHAGEYVCEVANRYGKDQALVRLNVNGIVSVQRVALRSPQSLTKTHI